MFNTIADNLNKDEWRPKIVMATTISGIESTSSMKYSLYPFPITQNTYFTSTTSQTISIYRFGEHEDEYFDFSQEYLYKPKKTFNIDVVITDIIKYKPKRIIL